jgi:DNA-binding MarR family transcriptional regulator
MLSRLREGIISLGRSNDDRARLAEGVAIELREYQKGRMCLTQTYSNGLHILADVLAGLSERDDRTIVDTMIRILNSNRKRSKCFCNSPSAIYSVQ